MRKNHFILILIIGLFLASCGGGGPSTTIDVTLTDFQFLPNTFNIPAGQEITINAVNNGAVVHNFVIVNFGANAGDSWEDEDISNVYWEVELQPGGDTSTTFIAPTEPGEYQVICRTEGHIMAGMVGKIIVVAGE
jgi:plastocyanin